MYIPVKLSLDYNDPMNRQFVSRGGIKLQAALDEFKIDPTGLTCLDVGSSTGGFVDCLLQNGAQKVYAVDTSYGELAWKLRKDANVVALERTNILHLSKMPEPVDLITIDSGWTKLELVLPIVAKFLKKDGRVIALLKPQYEVDPDRLVKGLVPESFVEEVKNQTIQKITQLGWIVSQSIDSPILGGAGNKEFLIELFDNNH